MISIKQRGSFNNFDKFTKNALTNNYLPLLHRIGRDGVDALMRDTPSNTGKTAASWDYEIEKTKFGYKVQWINNNIVDGIPIAILLQYGHGTRSGTYVNGIDYINPAIKPVFKSLSDRLWEEVKGV